MREQRACFLARRAYGFPHADDQHPSSGAPLRRLERAPRVRVRGGCGACVLAGERQRDPAHTGRRHRTV